MIQMILQFTSGNAQVRYTVSHVTEFYLSFHGLTLITVTPITGKRHHLYPGPIADLSGFLAVN